MATYYPITALPVQIVNPDTRELASGFVLESYIAGTSTPTEMYIDREGTSAGASVTINSSGWPEVSGNIVNIWVEIGVDYKFILKDEENNTEYTVDSIGGITLNDSIDKYESLSEFVLRSPQSDSVFISSYYTGWAGTISGPKGSHSRHKTGATNVSPTVGSAVSVSTIGTGDQAGYCWDASGAEWRITETESLFDWYQFGAYGDDSNDDTIAINDCMSFCSRRLHRGPKGIFKTTGELILSGPLQGDGVEACIVKQYTDSSKILRVTDNTDYFRLGGFQLQYAITSNTQTDSGLFLENENHNAIIEDVLILGGAPGLHSDQVSFWQTYRNVRVQFATSQSFLIEGARNDDTGSGTTILMQNCGTYNGNIGLSVSTVAQLQIDTFEVGTHDNFGMSFNNIKEAVISCPHFEVNDYGSSFAKAFFNLASTKVIINGLHSQDNTATVANYVVRCGEDVDLEINGITRGSNTNQELYYIQDNGNVSTNRIQYMFRGHGFGANEVGEYISGSTGKMSFPEYEEYIYSNATSGASGVISQNFPSEVPGELSILYVNSFIDDGGAEVVTTSDRFSGSVSVRVRSISDGATDTTDGRNIRTIVKYGHS